MESNDSLEIPDRGETSEIPGLPSGASVQTEILITIIVPLSHPAVSDRQVFDRTAEGRLGMSDVSPLSGISGLSFDPTLLSPLVYFCLVLLLFLSDLFLPAGPFL